MSWISIDLTNPELGQLNISKINQHSIVFGFPCSTGTSCTSYVVTLSAGTYRFECYGAGRTVGGSFTSGYIDFHESKTLFLFVGGQGLVGSQIPAVGGYNGGGGNVIYGTAGSGASDIRLDNGDVLSFSSLRSRIMVAGGSGGSECGIGGSGGALEGKNGNPGPCAGTQYSLIGFGGTQITGGNQGGQFGYTKSFDSASNRNGGGGGYYGGGNNGDSGAGGGGGSSFVSGHLGCDAILENSTETSISHSGQPIHYSDITFYHTVIKSGDEFIINRFGSKVLGHIGHGLIIITKIQTSIEESCYFRLNIIYITTLFLSFYPILT